MESFPLGVWYKDDIEDTLRLENLKTSTSTSIQSNGHCTLKLGGFTPQDGESFLKLGPGFGETPPMPGFGETPPMPSPSGPKMHCRHHLFLSSGAEVDCHTVKDSPKRYNHPPPIRETLPNIRDCKKPKMGRIIPPATCQFARDGIQPP